MSSRRHRRDMAVLSEMNLTNLLDTALVLVLALLMVTPVMKQGVSVVLPQTVETAVLNSQPKTITISIGPSELAGAADHIYIEDARMANAEQAAKMVKDRQALYPKLGVVIEVDRKAGFETFAQVMAALQAVGIENVDMPTEPVPFDALKHRATETPSK
jgi:biopolymer transport protein ExbD